MSHVMQLVLVAALAAFVGALAATAVSVVEAQTEPGSHTVREIRVVDEKGVLRMKLGAFKHSHADAWFHGIALYSPRAQMRVSLTSEQRGLDNPSLVLYHEVKGVRNETMPRAILTAHPQNAKPCQTRLDMYGPGNVASGAFASIIVSRDKTSAAPDSASVTVGDSNNFLGNSLNWPK